MSETIMIAGRAIGRSHQPFIIAEMSGNHNQSLDRALAIVEAAAKAGAHALKLQTYTADTMTLDLDHGEFFIDDPNSLWKGRSLHKLYQEAYTPWEWHKPIFERARALGMIPFSTPFDASPDVAAVILKLDDGHPWLAYPASRIPALHALTGKRFIQPEQGCSHGFVRWNHRSPIHTWAQYRQALAEWARLYGRSFIVLEFMPRDVPASVFRPLTGRLQGYDGQVYIVGILAPHEPTVTRAYPHCASIARGISVSR